MLIKEKIDLLRNEIALLERFEDTCITCTDIICKFRGTKVHACVNHSLLEGFRQRELKRLQC